MIFIVAYLYLSMAGDRDPIFIIARYFTVFCVTAQQYLGGVFIYARTLWFTKTHITTFW